MQLLAYRINIQYIVFILLWINLETKAIAQTRLLVGVHSSPTYYNNHYNYPNKVVEFYEGLDRNQFYIANGISIDFRLNRRFNISLYPSLFQRKFYSDCVNIKSTNFYSVFTIASPDNCLYTTKATFYFLRIPLTLRVLLIDKKDWQLYIGGGNSINYGFKTKSSISEKKTNYIIQEGTGNGKFFLSWFSPTIEGGLDYKLTKRIILSSNLNIQTEKKIFSNFSIGLGIGAKVGLL